MMPGMDGFELAQHVHQLFAEISVIFTSAQPENLRRLPSGLRLEKPFHIDTLIDVVKQNLPCLSLVS
jgi:CheY-like chemotaxis protein